ncbi:hypothetical protein B0H13DRAFT_1189942 [Mycena leptocephala]|nr:hypothetical protein B0H13DRAFT_1189942 [Mycena leptocephala]
MAIHPGRPQHPMIPPQLVRAWLTRATGLPRRIQMETSDPVRGEALLAVSMEFCAQWQDIGLALPLQSFSALVAHHGPFPLLRSLSLSICSGLINGDETITIRDAPLLRKVTLKDFPFLALDMAWDQLTALDMTVQDAEPGISALQHCSNLEELHFLLVDQGRLPTITPFTLPSLLWLVTAGKNSILSFLTLPRLAQLDISGPGFSRNSMARLTEDLRGMVQRSESGSACPLQNLSFRMPPDGISAAEFEAFLRAVPPSVVDFRLTLHVRGALEMVGAVLRVPGVLPGMRTLRLTYDIKSVAGSSRSIRAGDTAREARGS